MEGYRWLSLLYISIVFSFISHFPTAISSKFSGAPALNLNLPLTTKEIRRLKAKGVEVVPSGGGSITSNSVTSEPTCEELRAMWRYYKRQSRAAELTNQIPQMQLPDLFWDAPQAQQPSSFGPLRARTRPRFRMQKGPPKQALYGRVLNTPSNNKNKESPRRRPVEEVVRMFGPTNINKNLMANNDRVSEPTLHLSPPVEPTQESGFQKLKDMYRKERMKSHKSDPVEAVDNSNGPPLVNRDFGKMILTPPQGQDGRIANKPKELMSPFEKLRFHSDDILGVGDEIDGRHNMMSSFMSKRRNGFIGIPMLNPKSRYNTNSNAPVKDTKNLNRGIKSSTHGDNSNVVRFQRPSNPEGLGLGPDDMAFTPGFTSTTLDETLIPVGDYNLDSSSEDLAILIPRKPTVKVDFPPACSQVESQVCSTNSDCSCVGYGLYRCFLSQCQVLNLISADGDDWGQVNDGGFWHPGALADKHLGAWEQSSVPISGTLEDEEKRKKVWRPSA